MHFAAYCFPHWKAMQLLPSRLPGADHEFATIKGVIEDVTEIILNLKQVRLKKADEGDVMQDHAVINIKGKEKFTAGMIGEALPSFEVMNPDLVICNMDTTRQPQDRDLHR